MAPGFGSHDTRRAQRPVCARATSSIWLLCALSACEGEPGARGARGAVESTADQPCLEDATPIRGSDRGTLGVSAEEALSWPAREYTEPLEWSDGSGDSATRIAFSFDNGRAFHVSSRATPKYTLNLAVECRDTVEVRAAMEVSTEDGKLALSRPEVRLTADARARALTGVIGGVAAKDLRGRYAPAREGECFEGTQLNVSFSASSSLGSMTDSIASARCDDVHDLTGVSPRDGASWGPKAPPEVPDDWKRVTTECGFSFRAPPDVREVPVRFSSGGLTLGASCTSEAARRDARASLLSVTFTQKD